MSAGNLTMKDVLRALQSSTDYSNNSSSSSNATTSYSDARANYANNVNANISWLMEAAAYSGGGSSSAEEMMISGPISDWLRQLSSNDRYTSSASSFVSSNILSHFIRQVGTHTLRRTVLAAPIETIRTLVPGTAHPRNDLR